MRGREEGRYWGVVLDAPDPARLAEFYAEVLGWTIVSNEPTWCTLGPDEGAAYVAIQRSDDYVVPTWPSQTGHQQMMMHLDIEVGDLDAATAHARELGASLAEFQPQEHVRVLIDPAGHPFCLYLDDVSIAAPR